MLAQAIGGLLTQFCDLDGLQLCTTVAEALERIRADRPDLLILDLHLPGERWQDAAEALAALNPSAKLIILSANAADCVLAPGQQHQLLAVIDKGSTCDELLTVVADWKRQRQRHGPRCEVVALQQQLLQLCPRELRVFEALGKGLLNREIAMDLGLKLTTVETYRKSISSKLGFSGSELVRVAVLNRCLPRA